MDKSVEKKMHDFLLLLETINDSEMSFNPDNVLNSLLEKHNRKIYNDCSYFCSIFKMYGIYPNGRIREEFQELFNEKGFAIEQNKKGDNPFYIRTEKGIFIF